MSKPSPPPQPEPINISADYAGWATAIRSATEADAAGLVCQLIKATLDGVLPRVAEQAMASTAGARKQMIRTVMAEIEQAEKAAFLRGKRAGARSVSLDAGAAEALGTAVASAMAKLPPATINVAAPSVVIENEVIMPARTIVAKPGPGGTVTMTPVDP